MAFKSREKLEKQHMGDKNKFVFMRLGTERQNIIQEFFDANFFLKR